MTALATRLARLEQVYGGPTLAERRAQVEQVLAGPDFAWQRDETCEQIRAALLGTGPGLFDVPADPDEDGQDTTWMLLGTAPNHLFVRKYVGGCWVAQEDAFCALNADWVARNPDWERAHPNWRETAAAYRAAHPEEFAAEGRYTRQAPATVAAVGLPEPAPVEPMPPAPPEAATYGATTAH